MRNSCKILTNPLAWKPIPYSPYLKTWTIKCSQNISGSPLANPDKPLNQPKAIGLLTHGKEWNPQQRWVKLPVRYKEDPCSCHIGDANCQHPQEAKERLPPQAVTHGAGDGGGQEHQHQANQHLPFGQDSRLMEVSPQAEGGERLDVKLVGWMGSLGRGEPADQSTELIFPALSDDILHHRSMVAEVVGDLNSTGEFDLLITAVGWKGYATQLMADEGHTAIL